MQLAVSENGFPHEVKVKSIKFNGLKSVKFLKLFLYFRMINGKNIYKIKDFVRLATTVKHRAINVI